MKNNAIFLLVMLALLITGLGALYYQYSLGEFSLGVNDMVEQQAAETQPSPVPDSNNQATPAAETNTASEEAQLEAMPTVSQSDDLETLKQELESTQILEEDFSDL